MEVDLNRTGTKTLVLAFSTTCGFSERNLRNWKRLIDSHAASIRTGTLQIVLIDLTSRDTKNYIVAHGMEGLSVVARPDAGTVEALRLSMTPQTIAIANGRVLRVWSGLLDGKAINAIADVLGS